MLRPASVVLLATIAISQATTLEKLALDEMIQRSTEIVRGTVMSTYAVQRGSMIYTMAKIDVTERFKGPAVSAVEVAIPGGSLNGVRQSISGAPYVAPGSQYVFFLWTGRNAITQIIGLSQGLVNLKEDLSGVTLAAREPITESLVDGRTRQPVSDDRMVMTLDELRRRIKGVLGAAKE